MQTKSSLPEPEENRLRIALSCRQTHWIRTLYPHTVSALLRIGGPKWVNSKSGRGLVFVCTPSANLIGLPHVIASRDCVHPHSEPLLTPLLHFITATTYTICMTCLLFVTYTFLHCA